MSDNVKSYPKGDKINVSNHFSSDEFRCPCNNCSTTLIDQQLVEYLEILRESLATPIRITSGYRCAAHQAELKARGYETATGISQHQLGKAADIKTGTQTGEQLAEHAERAGFQSIGIGKEWIHVDLRSDKPKRRWYYSY